jgi:hypothetical protein
MMSLLSHAADGATESCCRRSYRCDVSHGMLSLPSHAGDGIAEVTLVMA